MHRPRTLVVITLLSVGVAVAAFAGPAVAGEELSKKEFQKEANDICSTASEDLGGVINEAFVGLTEDQVPSPEQIQVAADGALPIFRTSLDDIEDLEGPSAYEKKVDKLLDQYRAVADDIENDPAIAFSSEDENDIWAKADKQAKKLGLRDCRQGG